MITGELKSQVDKIWNSFWTGGVANPLTVIEQLTYLIFIRRIDEMETLEEKKANQMGIDKQLEFLRWTNKNFAGVISRTRIRKPCMPFSPAPMPMA